MTLLTAAQVMMSYGVAKAMISFLAVAAMTYY